MYEAFDTFLAPSTWHTGHPADQNRFLTVLATVVWNTGFNPDEMASHMRERTNTEAGSGDYKDSTISRCTSDAWAVYDFLKLTKAVRPGD